MALICFDTFLNISLGLDGYQPAKEFELGVQEETLPLRIEDTGCLLASTHMHRQVHVHTKAVYMSTLTHLSNKCVESLFFLIIRNLIYLESFVVPAGLELPMKWMLTLNSGSHCLHILRAGFTVMHC